MGFNSVPKFNAVNEVVSSEVLQEKQLGGAGLEASERNMEIMEGAREQRGALAHRILTSELTSNGLDVLPFAGSGKMIAEAAYGKTLSGKDLSGKDRIIHAAIGAGCLTLDFTGIGEGIKLGGKALPLVEMVGAKLAEKGVTRGAALFAKTAAFMGKHPELVSKAELFAEAKIKEFMTRERKDV